MVKTFMRLIFILVFLLLSNSIFSQDKVLFHEYHETTSDWNIVQWNILDTANVVWVLKEVVDNQGRVIELVFLRNGKIIDDGVCYLATRVEYEYQDRKIITRFYKADEPMLATDCEGSYMAISHLDEEGYIEKREIFFAFDFSNMDSVSIEEIKRYFPEHNIVIPGPVPFDPNIDFIRWNDIQLSIDYYSLSYAKMNGIYPVSRNYVINEGDYYYRDEPENALEKAAILNGIEKLKNSVSTLTAFTHPKFFYFNDCKCGMFNPKFFQLEIYYIPTDSTIPYARANPSIIPPNFEVGYSVIITGKQGDFFRIKFNEEKHPLCYQCNDSTYYVKKGTLGTWIYNYNDSIDDYDSVPLYEEPSVGSKIITKVKKENSVVIILDINGSWIFVETIAKGKKKRGWLDPKMQCGNPYGIDAGICD